MARAKKEIEIKEDEHVTIAEEVVSTHNNVEDTLTDTTNPVSGEETNDSVNCMAAKIPDYVDQKLQLYPQYPELYIDIKGGVYTSEDYKSKESTLYKNPYHNQ